MNIAIFAYEGVSPFMLSTPLEVFGAAFGAPHEIRVCSASERMAAPGGLSLAASHPLAAAGEADMVVLPGWRSVDDPVDPEIVAELRRAHERGAMVVGLCLGAFGLAEAGLLDGRRATTHWARAETFAARYPRVAVDAGALFVDEGQVVTSAGVASALDCCLHLLARLTGVSEANRIARHLVVAPQRVGAQPQLITRPTLGSSGDRRLAELLQSLSADPSRAPSLDELARQAGLSRRSLTRHIRAKTGGSLNDWVRNARLARAQELLAAGARGLDDVAHRSGFPDVHAMRTAFRGELGVTPSQWLARQRVS